MNLFRKCFLIAVMVFMALMLLAVDNPLKNAKIGQFVEYKMVTETMGMKTEMKMKQTVIGKDNVSVTLRNETEAMGQKMPPQEIKIMLDQPYEPYKTGLKDAKVTILNQGDETVIVNGKKYDCHFVKVKVVASSPNQITAVSTVWSSNEVPVTGIVKMVSESTMNMSGQSMVSKTTMEILSSSK